MTRSPARTGRTFAPEEAEGLVVLVHDVGYVALGRIPAGGGLPRRRACSARVCVPESGGFGAAGSANRRGSERFRGLVGWSEEAGACCWTAELVCRRGVTLSIVERFRLHILNFLSPGLL